MFFLVVIKEVYFSFFSFFLLFKFRFRSFIEGVVFDFGFIFKLMNSLYFDKFLDFKEYLGRRVSMNSFMK